MSKSQKQLQPLPPPKPPKKPKPPPPETSVFLIVFTFVFFHIRAYTVAISYRPIYTSNKCNSCRKQHIFLFNIQYSSASFKRK